jgi:hypothetical protein
MKKIMVLILLGLSACADVKGSNRLSGAVSKFRDGDVVCYRYYQGSISCVVLPNR